MSWSFALTAFGASTVEFVEAAIIVIAAATMAGWAPALYGSAAAAGILAVATAILGVTLLKFVPLAVLRGVIGALLLLFGVKWLAKATYRLGVYYQPHHGVDDEGGANVAFAAAFNGVLLEGAEVVFIILALGATGRALASAVVGAACAFGLVAVAVAAARRAVSQVPQVALKYGVGIMLTTFGTLWLGEALGIPWWGSDASAIWLALGNLAVSGVTVLLLRRARPGPRPAADRKEVQA